jgi:hypothetical protein
MEHEQDVLGSNIALDRWQNHCKVGTARLLVMKVRVQPSAMRCGDNISLELIDYLHLHFS